MIQQKIDFQFSVLNFVDDQKAADLLAQESPINKVPILVDGSEKIFDSRVIMNHLMRKHRVSALTIEQENIVSSIYSLLDTSVILFLLKHDGFDINGPGNFLKRNRARIPANLEYLKPWMNSLDPNNPSDWNYPSMSLYSYLYWADKRAGVIDLKTLPEFATFIEKFRNTSGVSETTF